MFSRRLEACAEPSRSGPVTSAGSVRSLSLSKDRRALRIPAARTRAPIWALAPRFETAAKKTRPPQRERVGFGIAFLLDDACGIADNPAIKSLRADFDLERSYGLAAPPELIT